MSDRLLHLEQHFLSNDECIQAVIDESGWNITHQEMCAANQDPLKSPCYYDGGGPLYDVTAQKLVGIVSTGADGCQDYPTVYERIGTVYEDWIKETICREHVEPKPSFCMEQDQHFNVVSEFKEDDDDDGQSWCLTRRDAGEGAQVVVEVCKESEHQLWNINGRGQMRSFHNKKLCMTNIKGEKKFAMKPCPKRKGNSNFTFIFDPIHNSLIWLSNKANFKRWGLRAVALLDIPSVDDEISKSVHVRKRNDDILQKWRIEYPDM
jgi:Trypsin./Ricin-type beta-trefoil lectin domain.